MSTERRSRRIGDLALELRTENDEQRILERERDPVRGERVPAYLTDELCLVVSRGLVATVAVRNLVVGHGAADTAAGGLEHGKPVASERQEE